MAKLMGGGKGGGKGGGMGGMGGGKGGNAAEEAEMSKKMENMWKYLDKLNETDPEVTTRAGSWAMSPSSDLGMLLLTTAAAAVGVQEVHQWPNE